ncbi:UNVERIFIED_CONTAM: hypothetical protein NCL1_41107 [Trichonephila clavipes]
MFYFRLANIALFQIQRKHVLFLSVIKRLNLDQNLLISRMMTMLRTKQMNHVYWKENQV